MARYFLLTVILGFINFFANCQPCDTAWQPNNKKKNFKLKGKYELKSNDLIKTAGVYVDELNIDKEVSYTFYRFFTDGQVFKSLPYCHNPDSIELSDLKYGWKGYYTVNSNKVCVEVYSDGYSGYVVESGVIEGNAIRFLTYKPRGVLTSNFNYPRQSYLKFKNISLNTLPDW